MTRLHGRSIQGPNMRSGGRSGGINRRGFLGAAGAAGAGLAALPASFAHARRTAAPGTARNLIFLVADGMSTGTLTLGDMLSHSLHDRPTTWVDLWSQEGVRRATCATFSANSLVTDSAASASAWNIGERINNEAVNFTPDGRQPRPLWVRTREAGKATGLVTTTRITHATPAGFIANSPRRDLEDDIAGQILARGVDVALGGGSAHFPEAALAAQSNLRVVRSRAELLGLPAGHTPSDGRVLGLFTPDHMHHELDRGADEPSLAEMARAALGILARAPDGFTLMIEGGRVDHGGHDNDAGALLFNQLAFDDALAVATAFARSRNDTLVIVTTDHATANPGLTFYTSRCIKAFERCGHLKRSFEWIRAALNAEASMDARQRRLGPIVEEATGVGLSEDELALVGQSIGGQRIDPFFAANGSLLVLGSVLANHLGVAFASPEHTADFVEVTAFGPGSGALPPMIPITALHGLVVDAMGLPKA